MSAALDHIHMWAPRDDMEGDYYSRFVDSVIAVQQEAMHSERLRILHALPLACENGDGNVCKTHHEILIGGRCEDYDRGVRDAVLGAIIDKGKE